MSSSERDVVTYDPSEVASKWQQRWEADGLYDSDIDPERLSQILISLA